MENRNDGTWLGLADEVVAILRCTSCQGSLEQQSGGMKCVQCGHLFPLVDGVMRFVDAQEYAGSFGFQWLKHDRTQLDDETSRRLELFDVGDGERDGQAAAPRDGLARDGGQLDRVVDR